MLILLSIWMAVVIILLLLSTRYSAGLPLAYAVGLSIIHTPAALLYLDANEWDPTRLGFEQTVIGLVAFLCAVIIVKLASRYSHSNIRIGLGKSHEKLAYAQATWKRIALKYCLIGGLAYFVLNPLAAVIPSATAIMSSIGSLLVLGFCIALWEASQGGNELRYWYLLALTPILPLMTVLQGGFIGFGTYWMVTIFCFAFAQSKRRFQLIFLTPVILFLGLSLFVNYMAARKDLRTLVWLQQADVSDRLDRVGAIFENFEWLDLSNPKHRWAIDIRLNQNYLEGLAIARLASGAKEYASGTTLLDLVVALVPRALWPDKPSVGGGGDVVTRFTGLHFAPGTSVGTGQVFEFYVNFGLWGVIGGFLLWGALLTYLDLSVMKFIRSGNQRGTLISFLVGISLLQPGGNLVEVVVSAVGAIAAAYIFSHFFAGELPLSLSSSRS